MKQRLINILRYVLKKLAILTIWKFHPDVVGVTGSVGKTSTKLAIAAVLSLEKTVRVSGGNLNNDLGLPLTILGDFTPQELRLISREYPAGKDRLKIICNMVNTRCYFVISR